jgi:hypothetical protein
MVFLIIFQGQRLESPLADDPDIVIKSHNNLLAYEDLGLVMGRSLANNLNHPLSLMFLQIAVIVLIARLFGLFFNRIGQPTVLEPG